MNENVGCGPVGFVFATQMLAALYQNFVVSGFGVEGEQLKRYEQGQAKLAGILGLEPSVKLKVRYPYPHISCMYVYLYTRLKNTVARPQK